MLGCRAPEVLLDDLGTPSVIVAAERFEKGKELLTEFRQRLLRENHSLGGFTEPILSAFRLMDVGLEPLSNQGPSDLASPRLCWDIKEELRLVRFCEIGAGVLELTERAGIGVSLSALPARIETRSEERGRHDGDGDQEERRHVFVSHGKWSAA